MLGQGRWLGGDGSQNCGCSMCLVPRTPGLGGALLCVPEESLGWVPVPGGAELEGWGGVPGLGPSRALITQGPWGELVYSVHRKAGVDGQSSQRRAWLPVLEAVWS